MPPVNETIEGLRGCSKPRGDDDDYLSLTGLSDGQLALCFNAFPSCLRWTLRGLFKPLLVLCESKRGRRRDNQTDFYLPVGPSPAPADGAVLQFHVGVVDAISWKRKSSIIYPLLQQRFAFPLRQHFLFCFTAFINHEHTPYSSFYELKYLEGVQMLIER